jgi:hypothetical protein
MFWVEENGGKWVMEHLDRWARNVQFKPTQFPNHKTFYQTIFPLDYTQYIPICQV